MFKYFFNIIVLFFVCTNFCVAQQNEFSLKTQNLKSTKDHLSFLPYLQGNKKGRNINLQNKKPIYTSIKLFKRMPNCIYKKSKRPIFCELEHQLSRAINKNVKFGVEP